MIAFVIYSDRFVAHPHHASTIGPFVFIREEFNGDTGLKEHELTHVRQWWRGGLFVHSLRYMYSWMYRYKCELEAYREQMLYNPDKKLLFASFLAGNYNLPINIGDASKALATGDTEVL